MRRTGERLIRVAAAGILFLLLFCVASASAERKLTAGCPSLCSAKVTARWQKDDIILSLPGSWDLSRVTLESAEGGTLLLGNEMTPVVPGEPADLTGFIGKRTVIRNENKRSLGYLMILQGSRISALFLEVDPNALVAVNGSKKEQITEGHAVYLPNLSRAV